jgi:hypothetical protein
MAFPLLHRGFLIERLALGEQQYCTDGGSAETVVEIGDHSGGWEMLLAPSGAKNS